MNGTSTFSATGPLPDRGTLVIEASAGTGKTYTLAGLATRFVAETDLTIDRLLVVTYTRAAAAELRDRIRSRLVEAASHLSSRSGAPETQAALGKDAMLDHLAADDVPLRLARLDAAVRDLDTATITTIHGFCQQVLATLGTNPHHDSDAVLVQDTSTLMDSVCRDLLASAALDHGDLLHLDGVVPGDQPDLPGLKALHEATRTTLGNPGLVLLPDPDDTSATPSARLLARMTGRAAGEVHRRLVAAGNLAFDDLLTRVRDLVVDDAELCDGLRLRFGVTLIDEFQDTDPVQWQAFSTLFGGDRSTLVLVGDPKQAIYGFRGGDIATYLAARSAAGTRRATLNTNWRADGATVDALDHLFTGATFGDDAIAFVPVAAAPHLRSSRLHDSGRPAATLVVRTATHPSLERNTKGRKEVTADAAREAIVVDLARQVRDLLNRGEVVQPDPDPDRELGSPDPDGRRRLTAKDIAVLVKANDEGPPIQSALRALGVASVITRGTPVTQTPGAEQWRLLLNALAQPTNIARARAAALSWFCGWTPAELDAAGSDEVSDLQDQLHRWAETTRRRGMAALVRQIHDESALTERILGRPGGERDLTDVHHLAELLHGSTGGQPTSAAALITGLDQLAAEDPETEALKRRIDTDEDAVQIMTIHVSKGLEFGVVCCPSLFKSLPGSMPTLFHRTDPDQRCYDVAANSKASGAAKQHRELALEERHGEQARLAYVALTRAKHATYLWWANTSGAAKSAVFPLLFPGESSPPDDDRTVDALRSRFADAGDLVSVEEVPQPAPTSAQRRSDEVDHVPATDLARAELGHPIDRSRGRWSFTAVTSHDLVAYGSGSDPDDDSLGERGAGDEGSAEDDRAGVAATAAEITTAAASFPLPLADVGAGTAFGTLVHAVLERTDFTAEDLDAELDRHLHDLGWMSDTPLAYATLGGGLRAAIETTLGDAFAGTRLRDLTRSNRLDELEFELPLAVGRTDPRSPAVTPAGIGRLLIDHLPGDDRLRPWAGQLADGRFPITLAGYLTGSIDGLFRITDPDGCPRFHVVDYKTNWLGRPGLPLTLDDYHPDRLPEAMAHHHYPLQALLYAVAVHRYLRWRLPDYDPARHLGAAGYLFLRGMAGPDTPTVAGRTPGVFSWAIPPALVTDVSDLLHGVMAEERAS
jgi:exodeoxyribonuclease V beta subunit